MWRDLRILIYESTPSMSLLLETQLDAEESPTLFKVQKESCLLPLLSRQTPHLFLADLTHLSASIEQVLPVLQEHSPALPVLLFGAPEHLDTLKPLLHHNPGMLRFRHLHTMNQSMFDVVQWEIQQFLNSLAPSSEQPSLASESITDDETLDQYGFFELKEQSLARFEKNYLSRQLTRFQGDVSAASNASRMPRGTFYRLMKKYDLTARQYRKRRS
jgi:DNA-binding NtrC family response regulator